MGASPFAGRSRLFLAAAMVIVVAIVVTAMVLTQDGGSRWAEAPSATTKAITGTTGNDYLKGNARGDLIFAFGGEDHIDAGGGNDLVDGGNRKDTIDSGAGDDRIRAYDDSRDIVRCGPGYDVVYADPVDALSRCEERYEHQDTSSPQTPYPPDGSSQGRSTAPAMPVVGRIVLNNEGWQCAGSVDVDLVKITMRTTVDDAISIDQNCSGRIGRIEVDTWTADGVKVQNRGTVAHDLVIESGYVKCHDVFGDYHQDGIHVMGGRRLTFRNLAVDCLGNANLFLSRGGGGASTPTDVVCDRCTLGRNSAQTLYWWRSLRSGARNTTICTGRYRAVRIDPGAEERVNVNNTVLPRGHPSCADVTDRERHP